MLYNNSEIDNTKFIFDHTYKTIFERDKLAKNDDYFYFKTLSKIKDKFRTKNKDIGDNVFTPKATPKKFVIFGKSKYETLQSEYHVEKIKNNLFKIHRNSFSEGKKLSPQRPQTQTINFDLRNQDDLKQEVRPKLEEIVNRHREMQRNYRLKKQEYVKEQMNTGDRSLKTTLISRRK